MTKVFRKLTANQVAALKAIKQAPKTTAKLTKQFQKKDYYITTDNVHSRMRGLEDRSLVRRTFVLDKKLNRYIIEWEITASGLGALEK